MNIDSSLKPGFFSRLGNELLGIARDFWADAEPLPEYETTFDNELLDRDTIAVISLKNAMWLDGQLQPSGAETIGRMVSSLNLNSEMSFIDLTAGLGIWMQRLHEKYGTKFIGLERDPFAVSCTHYMKNTAVRLYSPPEFALKNYYDGFIARTLFYNIPHREKFFSRVAARLKKGAQISFTDYIIEDENALANPAVTSWIENEKDAQPLSTDKMKKLWQSAGCDISLDEDMTKEHVKEVLAGLQRLQGRLESEKPEEATNIWILAEVAKWEHCLRAMQSGLSFKWFYGVKKR